MRKESTVIFVLALLISAGTIGTLSYLHHVENTGSTERFGAPPAHQIEPRVAREPSDTQQQAQSGSSQALPQQQISGRTDTPIECPLPDGATFWTNAATCEGADLHNRISIADPPETWHLDRAEREQRSSPTKNSTLGRDAAIPKPTIHGPGRAPPSGLRPECRFPVGRALEIERMLATADNPYESGWRKSYCRFRNEAIDDQCPVADSYYYYRYDNMCRRRY
jgi:hypothetical protein